LLEQHLDQSREAVARISSAALARRMNGRREDIPAPLVEAIVSGQGNRTAILEETRRVLGTAAPLDLVLFDTDSIARYVFESSRPPVIAGASTILRDLNERIARGPYEDFVIFSGGGEGLLLAPAGLGAEICAAIERLYAEKTGGALTVTTGFLPVGPHEFVASPTEPEAAAGVRLVSGTKAVLSRLRDGVRRKKDSRASDPHGVTGGAERCVSCRDRAVGHRRISDFRRDARVDGPLCDPCALRWGVGKKEIDGISFEELVEAAGLERAKSKYIGFLYVDGNSMGALFGGLSSLAEIRFLSQAVREVFETLRSRVAGMAEKLVSGKARRDLPQVSYLGGGDEAIWILPAVLAVRVIETLSEWIEQASLSIADLPLFLERRTGSRYVTFGAGLVLCGYSYPVRYQFSLARDLQKNAKSMFYGSTDRAPVSAIDFEVLTESSPLSESLDTARALTDRTDDRDFRRSCRPYTAESFAQLLRRMRRLRDDDVKLATSQLYALQDGAGEGKRIFLNFLRYQIARKPAGLKYQKWLEAFKVDPGDPAAVERFFIESLEKGSGTWIRDGLELSSFLGWLED
jgi:CRISPR RNA silencing complex Cmr2 subunit-like protein